VFPAKEHVTAEREFSFIQSDILFLFLLQTSHGKKEFTISAGDLKPKHDMHFFTFNPFQWNKNWPEPVS
jgi:hypothetical protein